MLKKYLQEGKCRFIPYLGKNDHFANITYDEIILLPKENFQKNNLYLDSIFPAKYIHQENAVEKSSPIFFFAEFAPLALDKKTHMYILEEFVFTNLSVEDFPQDTYSFQNKNYVFF